MDTEDPESTVIFATRLPLTCRSAWGEDSMKAIGYIRVSTDRQAHEGVSLEMQTVKIKQYCELNDLELVEILSDEGISAKNIKGRPGFQKALSSGTRWKG